MSEINTRFLIWNGTPLFSNRYFVRRFSKSRLRRIVNRLRGRSVEIAWETYCSFSFGFSFGDRKLGFRANFEYCNLPSKIILNRSSFRSKKICVIKCYFYYNHGFNETFIPSNKYTSYMLHMYTLSFYLIVIVLRLHESN